MKKRLLAMLLAMAMVLSLGIISAFAEDTTPATDAQKAEKFKLTKILKMPEGTKTPASTFAFEITKNGDNNIASAPTFAEPVTISFTGNETQAAVSGEEGVVAVTKSLEDVFDGCTATGTYSYLIKELATAPTTQAGENEKYTYAVNQYIVNIYVDSNGDQTFTLQEKVTPGDEWGKIPAETETIEVPGESGTETKTINVDNAKFENTYVKTAATTPDGKPDIDDPTDPADTKDDTAFCFEKKVENDTGSLYAGTDFDFYVTVAAPSINSLSNDKAGYTYKVVKINSNPLQIVSTGVIDPAAEEATNIKLKTGERAVFTDLDVGAKVTVREAEYADFAQTANVNGTAATDPTAAAGIVTAVVQDDEKDLEVINTSNNNTTPTGILINNLPYIALALVAIGGLVAYVVVRRRNADEA